MSFAPTRWRLPSARSLQSRIVALFALLMFVDPGRRVPAHQHGRGRRRAQDRRRRARHRRARSSCRVMDQSAQRLVQGARVLSSDFAFRQAISTGDRETIASTLRNHGDRIDAAYMTLIGLDRRVVADSFDSSAEGRPFAFQRLIVQAERDGKAVAMVGVDGALYQVVVVPVLAPVPIAWVAMGFAVQRHVHAGPAPAHGPRRVVREPPAQWLLVAAREHAAGRLRPTLLQEFAAGHLQGDNAPRR
jgi:hypothetical protein